MMTNTVQKVYSPCNMASHLLSRLVALSCVFIHVKGSISLMTSPTAFFCPLNGSIPACDQQFQESNFSSSFEDLDSLINMYDVMDSKLHIATLCSDFDTYRDLMNCSSPGLAACQRDILQRLDLVPHTDRWVSAMRYLCDNYQDMDCKESGFGKATLTCIERVKNDSASVDKLASLTDDAQTIHRFCSLHEDFFDCFLPVYNACGFTAVLSHLREGLTLPPCDVESSTLPSGTPPSSSEKSRGITLIISQLNQLACLLSVALVWNRVI